MTDRTSLGSSALSVQKEPSIEQPMPAVDWSTAVRRPYFQFRPTVSERRARSAQKNVDFFQQVSAHLRTCGRQRPTARAVGKKLHFN